MITQPRECSCGGNNTECWRCNGSGMIAVQDGEPAHSENFEIAGYLAGMEHEVITLVRNRTSLPYLEFPPPKVLCCCVACRASLAVSNLQRHFSQAHLMGHQLPRKVKPHKRQRRRRNEHTIQYLRCPRCKLLIRESCFSDHRRRHFEALVRRVEEEG